MHYQRTITIGAIVAMIAGGLCALTQPGVADAKILLRREASSTASVLPSIVEVPPGTGINGYPYDAVPPLSVIPPQLLADGQAPYINLSGLGYVEEEFIMKGGATEYAQSGSWGSNGDWNVSVSKSNVPYTTRLLVRYPTNPAKFNGTVVFEWLNDTTGGDQDPVWAQIYGPLLADGFAYVGVTAQNAGLQDLVAWDSARYGSLGDSSDLQSYDIFTQAAKAVVADSATILGGLTPKRLIGTGDSQSAFRIDTYVNAIQPVTHEFNGFMAVGRAVTAAPIGSGLISISPFPALIRTNNTAPFLQINTQGDIEELDAGAARQSDNNDLRTWELAGAAHIDTHEAAYEIEALSREEPTLPIPACALGTPIEGTGTPLDGINQADSMPLFEVEDAGITALQTWLTTGAAPVHSPQISTTSVFFGIYYLVNTDSNGNALGGIRLPELEAPADLYSPLNYYNIPESATNPSALISELESALSFLTTGGISNTTLRSEGLCLLSGYFTPFSTSKLVGLYGTNATYNADYVKGVSTTEAAGFLTPADGSAAIAKIESLTTVP